MKKLLFCMVMLLAFVVDKTFAVQLSNFYQVQIPVASQADPARKEAMREGLTQVLLKVSGDHAIAKAPTVRKSLQNAENLVQEYSYEPADNGYLLNVLFDRSSIALLLKKSGLPFWGETRPLTLVWLTYPTEEKNFAILSNESSNDLLTNINQISQKYGLPITFPAGNLADLKVVSVQDVQQLALPKLQEVSKPYQNDAMLIANIEKNNDQYQSRWQLILGEKTWDWTLTNKALDPLITEAFNKLSHSLAEYYVGNDNVLSEQWFTLEVVNVKQRAELKKLVNYLKQLTNVQEVNLAQISDESVQLSLFVRGSLQSFQQNASIGQRLILQVADVDNNKLVYKWLH